MRIIFTLAALAFSGSITAAAQQAPPSRAVAASIIDYETCTWTNFCLDCGTPAAGLANITPDAFVRAALPEKQTKKLKGTLLIQVMIDSLGRACCNRIQNFTSLSNQQIKKLALDKAIANASWQFVQTAPHTSRTAAARVMLRAKFDGPNGFTADYYRISFDSVKPGK